MVEQRQAVANLYAHQPSTPVPEEEVRRAIRESLNRPSSPYDSHPSPLERSRWVRALGARGTIAPDDAEEVWTLFGDRATIERHMTETVRSQLR
jgi:aspartate/methionine/tyrosine aminotransferase